MTKFLNVDLDSTLGGIVPSDEKVPSQKAIKKYVDDGLAKKPDIDDLTTDLEGKVDKTTIAYQVYVTSPGNTQTTLTYSTTNTGSTIVQRTGDGQVNVAQTPSDSTNATSKKYVDDNLAAKVSRVSESKRIYGTDASGNQTSYDYDSFGKVDDVKVGTTSVVINKVASLGTMASEDKDDYIHVKTTPIVAATKTKITYDTNGIITAGADLQESDIPNLSLSKISDVTASAAELNKLGGITVSATELNYTDGLTSNIQTQLNNKQAKLVSGTNIKTLNSTSLLGSGNISITGLPAQTGNNGKFLKTDGSSASWTALATVATSGSYNDLSDKPIVTSDVTEDSTNLLTSGGAFEHLITDVTAGTTANKINVTKAGSTSTITVNNVANATTATKLGSTTVGGTSQPIYLNSGTPTAISYTIEKSVPSDAKFTDTTYSDFTGATDSSAGTSGLVKKPEAGDQNKFLKGNGDWALVDSFPSQSGNSGKFLTTNGTTVSWENIPEEIPLQSGNDGKFLTTNGTAVSWTNIPEEIPSQTGNSGKFLTTNGTAVSWAEVDVLPSQTGNNGKYLTTNGTDASWNSLSDVAVSGSYNNLIDKPSFNGIVLDNNTNKSFYGTSTSAADAVMKIVSIPSITTLDVGQIIIIQPTITSTVANSTLKLNDFNPYPMKYNNAAITTSTDSIVWNLSFPSIWVFDGSNWVFLAHGLDSNSTYTINYSVDAGNYVSGTGAYAISRYSLVMQKPDMTWEKITNTASSYSTGTTKTVNTNGFLLDQIRYYNTTTNLANGAKSATNVMYDKAASIDMRYSTNCGATTNWATGDYIYLVGTVNSTDGLFYLDTTTWWTKTLPSTNDGKVYIRLGIALTASSYTISLFEDHPAFYHDGTKICEYRKSDNKQDILISSQNIKTINNESILGSGNISINSLPSQTGNANKFLTTDGTDASWVSLEIDEYTTAEVITLWNSI